MNSSLFEIAVEMKKHTFFGRATSIGRLEIDDQATNARSDEIQHRLGRIEENFGRLEHMLGDIEARLTDDRVQSIIGQPSDSLPTDGDAAPPRKPR